MNKRYTAPEAKMFQIGLKMASGVREADKLWKEGKKRQAHVKAAEVEALRKTYADLVAQNNGEDPWKDPGKTVGK